MRVYLPTTFNPEGGGGKPASLLAGIRHMANRMLQIQLVAHPLCDFDHPFEPAGLVEKLWPEPSGKLDVNSLPILSSEGRRQTWRPIRRRRRGFQPSSEWMAGVYRSGSRRQPIIVPGVRYTASFQRALIGT